ncbi:MAG TPA: L,D-transpeptidase/peptidoglycan binding protein [Actinomycetota bacterium]|nr:L,D-transpeptidase/peptidoglycan binding protein [Actinomycetota bacterium]
MENDQSKQETTESVSTEAPESGAASAGPQEKDVIGARRRFHVPRLGRRWTLAILVVLGTLFLGAAGAAYATYDYSNEYDGRMLPGTTVAGVDVGGMDRDEALAAVRDAVRPQLRRSIEVEWEDRTWKVTPARIGAYTTAGRAVDVALAESADTSFFQKMKMRVLGDELEHTGDVGIRYPRKGARAFLEGIASSLNREVEDASLDYSSGWVKFVDGKEGRRVDVASSHTAFMKALRTGSDEVGLKVKVTKPEKTTEDFDQVLLVRIGENKLYLYEDQKITHEWSVATGQPEYMTPTGLFEVELKRYLPTWVNPAPDTWGANMPASIPPGPGNPLGVRAINWTAPAIRFHGTSATYSLGYNASHGCVRMANSDVIQLYDMIEVGTPIVSVVAGPLRPMYSSSSFDDPEPVSPEAENEATKNPAGDGKKPSKGDG